MRTRIMRRFAAGLAVILALTSINPFAVEAIAGDGDSNESSYTLNQLTAAGGYGFTSAVSDNDVILTYEAQYQEARYAVPTDIPEGKIITGVKVEADQVGILSIKLLDSSDNQLAVSYGTGLVNSASDEDSAKIAKIGLMSLYDGEAAITIKKVTFTYKDKPAEDPSSEKQYVDVIYSKNLSLVNRWNASDVQTSAVQFTDQYQEYVLTLDEAIPADKCKEFSINLKSQGNDFCIKLYNEEGNDTPYYGHTGQTSYTHTTENITGKIKAISVMSTPAVGDGVYPYTVDIDSIVFIAEEGSVSPRNDKSIDVGGEGLVFVNPWNSSDTQTGTITFNSQYSSYDYILPEAIPTAKVEEVRIKVSNQGNQVCFKLYEAESGNEWFHDYGAVGKTEYVYDADTIKAAGEAKDYIKRIGVMSMPAAGDGVYPYSITIESISIKLNGAITPSKPASNDIVIEGDALNFVNRWDMSSNPVGNNLTFQEQWNEFAVNLGEGVDLSKVDTIKVDVSEQGGTVAFKTYGDDGDGGYKELQAVYGKSGSTSYTFNNTASDKCLLFGVMGTEEGDAKYPYGIKIEKITFVLSTESEDDGDKEIEQDIVNLRDAVTATMNDTDFIIGTACSYDEFADSKEMELVKKHFNAVTLGNELKPDAMLKKNKGFETVTLNGQTFEFPVLDYSLPESRLDVFVEWNNAHPEKIIKIRGHVLVWHSQTPKWFFKEGYEENGAYVSPEVMSLREEYYIKSVIEHFTSANSPYKNLFYGWDVVNEAVSDTTRTYRSDSEKSDWWAVFKSPEFINNAFVYANKYMPADIELYYNDYNDTTAGKVDGIVALLEGVVNTPGARIDGMGMQAHYDMSNPSTTAFCNAARRYAAVVPSVQVTELDFKGSTSSTDENLTQRYMDVYDSIRRLRAEGVNFTAMTIWGVVDKHSWLQSQNSEGGGSSSNTKQYPLLFNNSYKAKGAFWAIANAGELMPEVKKITLAQSVDSKFSAGSEYSFKKGSSVVKFVPEWDENGINVKITVPDSKKDTTDEVTLYVYDGDSILTPVSVKRTDAKSITGGYEATATITVAKDKITANKVKLDIVVTDGENKYAFNDTRLKQAEEHDYYATTVAKASAVSDKPGKSDGTVTVDGVPNEKVWEKATTLNLGIANGANATATAKIAWDEKYLYVFADVKDAVLNDAASAAHEQDSIEIFIDENNGKTSSYDADDKQYRINYKNVKSYNGTKCKEENIESATTETEDGYRVEAKLKWTDITPKNGTIIGFDIQVNDADATGKRIGTLNWADNSGNGWSASEVFGTLVLRGEDKKPNKPEPEEPTPEDPTPTEPVKPAPSPDKPKPSAPVITPVEPTVTEEETEKKDEVVKEVAETTKEEVPEAVAEAEKSEEKATGVEQENAQANASAVPVTIKSENKSKPLAAALGGTAAVIIIAAGSFMFYKKKK